MHVLDGLESALEPIARAIEDDRVTGLAVVLARLDRAGAFTPEWFHPPHPHRYARKLIHRDSHARFVVVAMTWAPGQSSPLHDHAGLWGAEIVVDGTMSETMFALRERADDGRYRFERGTQRVCAKGAVSMLVPPLEYHDFGNAGDGVAHTLHVYGGDLTTSLAFVDGGDGWWNASRVEHRYDD